MTDHREGRDQLRAEAIRVLTRAAHETTDCHDRLDFADFLAHVLSAAAANVGGPERLLSARPGSFEASHLHALLRGTVGDEPDGSRTYRTEPLLVPLNVAELIESSGSHSGLFGLDEAIDAVGLRYSVAEDDDLTLDAWDADVDVLIRRYEIEYCNYADRFASVVRILGNTMTPPVDIKVCADANPTSCWWDVSAVTNPIEDDSDPLIIAVWRAAHHAVPLPSVDVRQIASTELTEVDEV